MRRPVNLMEELSPRCRVGAGPRNAKRCPGPRTGSIPSAPSSRETARGGGYWTRGSSCILRGFSGSPRGRRRPADAFGARRSRSPGPHPKLEYNGSTSRRENDGEEFMASTRRGSGHGRADRLVRGRCGAEPGRGARRRHHDGRDRPGGAAGPQDGVGVERRQLEQAPLHPRG